MHGKGIGGGKGRLIDKVINTLQNHYGMAIPKNTDNVYAMRKAVAALLHHSTNDPDSEKRHSFCPRRPDSRCKHQKDKITGEETYKQKINIDPAVSKLIAPVFSYNDCGSETLLFKCLHGETQNVNESPNNLIWARCPKRVHVGNSTFKAAVASAVISFNDGAKGLLPVFYQLGIEPGNYTIEGCIRVDLECIKQSDHKSADGVKARRKTLRAIRKGFNDKYELMRERHMPVDHFKSVFISDLSKLLL